MIVHSIADEERRKLDEDAERSLLGAILLKPDVFRELPPDLRPEHFGSWRLRQVFCVAREMILAGQAIDSVTVAQELARPDRPDRIGTTDDAVNLLAGCMEAVPHAENAAHYAKLVLQAAAHRQLVRIGRTLSESGQNRADIAGTLDSIRPLILELESQTAGSGWPEPKPLPSDLLPVEAFDEALLPESFRPWIMDIAERLQCPPDFPAVASMIVLAGIVGRKIGLRPKRQDDWQVIPNLWGAIIGRPGIMKTPALHEPLGVLRRFEADAKQQFDAAAREHEAASIIAELERNVRKDVLKKAIAAKQDTTELAAGLIGTDLPEPVRQRFLINDTTVEKLADLLNQNPNGVVLFRDELTGWLRSLDRDGQEQSRAFYLEAWNGTGRFTVDRITRGTLDVAAAIVSIIGGIQPSMLTQYLQHAVRGGLGDDGLIQRFQLAVWPDVSGEWRNVDRWPDSAARQQAFATCDRLRTLNPVELAAECDVLEVVPYLRFDDDAQDRFDEWRSELELHLRSGRDHPAIESHLSKYRSLIPSLALLHHLADEPDGGPVTQTALARALQWASYLESHARRMYGSVSSASTPAAKTLVRRIKAGDVKDGFSLRDVYRNSWSGLSDRETVTNAVELLVDLDWLHEERELTPGRTATRYRINPRVLKEGHCQN